MTKKTILFALLLLTACGLREGESSVGTSTAALGSDTSQYNFEAGVQGWAKSATKITTVATSTAQVFLGSQSLAVNFVTTGAANTQQVLVASTAQVAGKTITYHLFLPTGMKLSSLQVFAQENASNGWAWHANWQPVANLTLGAWNTLTIAIPAGAAPLQSIGVEYNISAAWSGATYVDSVDWPTGADAGVDAGVDAGIDAGPDDAGIDAGPDDAGVDAGTDDAGVDAGPDDAGVDAGTPPSDAGISAIRFGVVGGQSGVFSNSPVDPNLRTVSGWVKFRVTSTNRIQEVMYTLEDNAPSTKYQLLCTTWHTNQWEVHDSAQGGFLFTGAIGVSEWWFIAETNRFAGPATTLYYKKLGAATLTVKTGNKHPSLTGITRFLVGTDDAGGQNEWFDGDIAGIKVWNAELTKAELELEANQLSPVRTANLHAYYPLQSVATMLLDYSGNGRNLAPITTGGSWTVQSGPTISP